MAERLVMALYGLTIVVLSSGVTADGRRPRSDRGNDGQPEPRALTARALTPRTMLP